MSKFSMFRAPVRKLQIYFPYYLNGSARTGSQVNILKNMLINLSNFWLFFNKFYKKLPIQLKLEHILKDLSWFLKSPKFRAHVGCYWDNANDIEMSAKFVNVRNMVYVVLNLIAVLEKRIMLSYCCLCHC